MAEPRPLTAKELKNNRRLMHYSVPSVKVPWPSLPVVGEIVIASTELACKEYVREYEEWQVI
jgi:hypothetical protein